MARPQSSTFLIVFTFALLLGVLILWQAINVVLLGFSAILLAIFLHAVSRGLSRWCHVSYRMTLSLVILLLTCLLIALFWIATPLISSQLKALFNELPRAYIQLKEKLFQWNLFPDTDFVHAFFLKGESLFNRIGVIFSSTLGTVTSFFIFLLVGVYLSYSPSLYLNGFLQLISPRKRKKAESVLIHLGNSLRWWLMGKFISMFAIGLLTMIGLWLLHIPLAFILGLIAAVFAFVPYIGSILAAIPAILIGLTLGLGSCISVTILYLAIHALEGYFITPFIEQRTVFLPPALTIMVQILLLMLVGFFGFALASPLTVVALALIKKLYIKTTAALDD